MSELKLKQEGGITRYSTDNSLRLHRVWGRVVRVECHYDPNAADWYRVKACYDNGNVHTFTGFSWGYVGEGPRGFEQFCKLNELPIDLDDIAQFDNRKKGIAWVWPEVQ